MSITRPARLRIVTTVLSAAALVLAACVPKATVKPPPPSVVVPPPPPQDSASLKPLVSAMSVPISLSGRYLQQLVNTQLPELLYQSDSLAFGAFNHVSVKAWRRDSITLQLNNDELVYRIPLKIWIRIGMYVSTLGMRLDPGQQVEAGIALRMRSRLVLGDNYKLSTYTRLDGYDWISPATMKLGNVTIPITPVADAIISSQRLTLAEQVDALVDRFLDIKQFLRPVWQKLQSPIKIAEKPPLWLRLSPQAVSLTPLRGRDGAIQTTVSLRAIAETFVGQEPPAVAADSLPPFSAPGSADSGFVIYLFGEIPYAEAQKLAKNALVGKVFTFGARHVMVYDLLLYGEQGWMIVGVELTGSFDGTIYLLGRPRYDPATGVLDVKDLDFDVSTRNSLLKSASWLFHGNLAALMREKLTFPVAQTVEGVRAQAQPSLRQRRLNRNLTADGSLDSLTVTDVKLTKDALRVTILGKGKMRLMATEDTVSAEAAGPAVTADTPARTTSPTPGGP